jgi:hypothetical protein
VVARFFKISFFLAPLAFFLCTGCQMVPLPPANLSTPGWRVQQGQAVWKPTANRPEIAGDLILATNANGNCFIQFSKSPFTLATAQIADGRWQIQFGVDQFSWRGIGAPPNRFVWFQLPRAFLDVPVADNWHFESSSNNWRFENSHTGETLEGGFFP